MDFSVNSFAFYKLFAAKIDIFYKKSNKINLLVCFF